MNIYVPSSGPDDWQRFLAEPEKHWRPGFSAQAVALSWESSNGVPPEIDAALGGGAELLIAIPEHKVPLPGGQRASQCDVFALVRRNDETIALAVEGKVREAFGPTLGEWYARPSRGKTVRLNFIKQALGRADIPPQVPYQLLHRTVASIVEAGRFKTDGAAMIVQSFAEDFARFDDYAVFASFLGLPAAKEGVGRIVTPDGLPVFIGWAQGDLRHLKPRAPIAPNLYDVDFYAWTERQASSLRRRSPVEIDWENVAEEIESLGRSDKYEIENRLEVLLLHLLKWAYQPEKRKPGWRASITEQRNRIRRRIRESPSLRSYPQTVLDDAYRLARANAESETGLPLESFPDSCPFDANQVLDEDFLPDAR